MDHRNLDNDLETISYRSQIDRGGQFFRFSEAEERELDFKHRVELGPDTGGGNWPAYIERSPPIVSCSPKSVNIHIGSTTSAMSLTMLSSMSGLSHIERILTGRHGART